MAKDQFIRLEHAVIGLFVILGYGFHFSQWGWFIFWLIFPYAIGYGLFLLDRDKRQPEWKFLLHQAMFTYITPIVLYVLFHMMTGLAGSLLAGWVTAVAIYRVFQFQSPEWR